MTALTATLSDRLEELGLPFSLTWNGSALYVKGALKDERDIDLLVGALNVSRKSLATLQGGEG